MGNSKGLIENKTHSCNYNERVLSEKPKEFSRIGEYT